MNFTVPNGGIDYSDRVFARTKQLISAGLWDIPYQRLLGWHDGFNGREQLYFAACLLDSLIYRTPGQFSASLSSLYRGGVAHACSPHIHIEHDLSLIPLLQNRWVDPLIRLVPVISDFDPPSKSGPLVMRRLKKEIGIADKWMIWPWQIEDAISKGTKLIILVDDMMGSGNQIEDFCKKEKIREAVGTAKVVYAPTVAHQTGINHINSIWPTLQIVTAELLTEEHNFFSQDNWDNLSQGKINADDARDFYVESILPQIGFRKGSVPALGYGELALCFGFSHSTPNNTLPIFWYETNTWPSLLER